MKPLSEAEIARIMADARATFPQEYDEECSRGEALYAVAGASVALWAIFIAWLLS